MKRQKNELRIPSSEKIADMAHMAELGEKARVVFHDLANYITALTLSIGHLEYNIARDSERLLEYSKRSERTRIQMEYVSDLLRSHIENRENSEFDPRVEIHKIAQTFADKAARKKILLITPTPAQTGKNLMLHGNRTAFTHIFTNLITNALESFELVPDRKSKCIVIELKKHNGNLVISVRDTGCGIKTTNTKLIFNKGYTTKKSGHGIGLNATKEYVERELHGTIEIRNCRPGTEFLVRIPANLKEM